MTVRELIEILSKMPQDAVIKVKHDLVGDEHFVEKVELKNDFVWIKEIY